MLNQAVALSALLSLVAASPWGPPAHWTYHPTSTKHTTSTTKCTTSTYHPTSTKYTSTHHTTETFSSFPFPAVPSASASTGTTSIHHTTTSAAPTALITAKFDDLPVPSAKAAIPIGMYDQLFYENLVVAKLIPEAQVDAVAAGIVPESSPNVAYYDPTEITANGAPALLSQFSGSNITTFSLDSFYFACANVASHITGSNPDNCTVVITGYDATGDAVAIQTLKYVTDAHTQTQQMTEAIVNSEFTNLSKVTFVTTSAGAKPVATFLDNVVYSVVLSKGKASTTTSKGRTSTTTAKGKTTTTSAKKTATRA